MNRDRPTIDVVSASYTSQVWRLRLGLSLSVFGAVIALVGIGTHMMLMFSAIAVLTVFTSFIQLSLWSRIRNTWL